MNNDEKQIRDLLDSFAHAIHNKDAAGAIAPLAADAVVFGLDPPLRHNPEVTHDPAPLEKWFATWKGPGPDTSESQDLSIAVGGDVAYAYGLRHMTGTKTNGAKTDLWFRETACFRREGGRWRITHMHNSVPFAMDGSDKALLDLQPD